MILPSACQFFCQFAYIRFPFQPSAQLPHPSLLITLPFPASGHPSILKKITYENGRDFVLVVDQFCTNQYLPPPGFLCSMLFDIS
jgi:hypothetical protein